MGRCIRWGTHDEFAGLYEFFLDRVYPSPEGSLSGTAGRDELVASIESAILDREATEVLDCAAGTGFPGLDLAARANNGLTVHCSDGDPAMVAVLEKRLSELGLLLDEVAPPRWPGRSVPDGADRLILDWAHLNRVEGRYDYVLCRGNSLAYADTWAGRHRVATEAVLTTYLRRMADKVRPGGFLHVDAPWELALAGRSYREDETERGMVWEKVTVDRERREWWLSFKPADGGAAVQFKRYSSLLTINRVQETLQKLGFAKTKPLQMDGERPVFGTIIARKPG